MHMKQSLFAAGIALATVVFAEELAPFPTWGEPYAVTKGPHEHLFASYFAIDSWSPNHRYVSVLETDLNGRLPEPNERCTLGLVDLQDGNKFIPVTTTACWNFQEAAMAHWIDDDTLLFNDVRNGKFVTVIMNWKTKAERILPLPVSAVSEDRTWAVSINYARLSLTRPDYGYAGPGQDAREDVEWPEDDGLWVMDLKTGEHKLILSVAQGRSLMPATQADPKKPGHPLAYYCHTVAAASRTAGRARTSTGRPTAARSCSSRPPGTATSRASGRAPRGVPWSSPWARRRRCAASARACSTGTGTASTPRTASS